MVIENRLSILLGERRMSVAEFARGAGVAYATAHQMYHGRTTRWDAPILVKTCRFLGVQVGDLLVYVPRDPEQADSQLTS
ncbi:MAG: helix-turn-helix transcriptional regulator [Chloroflexota bacterium]|nr:helix-turn-helix transcriptional regulator [Chloroflexota bacterium]